MRYVNFFLFQDFISEIMRQISLLGEEVIFSSPLGQQNVLEFSDFLFIVMLSLNFSEQLTLNRPGFSESGKAGGGRRIPPPLCNFPI